MELNDKQRVQAAKDIWRLMYERDIWRAEQAIDTYRREAEERMSRNPWDPPHPLVSLLCVLTMVVGFGFFTVAIGSMLVSVLTWFWWLAGGGALVGAAVAIMLIKQDG